MKTIRKSPGPDEQEIYRGHCYDGPGWQCCDFWAGHKSKIGDNSEGISRCLLFSNIIKDASQALICCDKIYGTSYNGRP